MLDDDCLGRALDWYYTHDQTKFFVGIARRARQVFGVFTTQVHVDGHQTIPDQVQQAKGHYIAVWRLPYSG